ncbi:MAG: hypothetical protein IJS15_07300 [Victivallales bacterium]|nr:hypothetical protein [Victivallales bacterium]
MKNSDNTTGQCRADSIAVAVALLYLLLLAVPVKLPCNILACDLLAFAMFGCLAVKFRSVLSCPKQHELRTHASVFPPTMLMAYLATALLSTAIHLHCTFAEYYEWLVFAFVAFLYHFYSSFRVSRRTLAICGCAILFAVQIAFGYETLASVWDLDSHFCFISEQMESTEMAFLSRRFAFTFDNPNSFACFYMLPLAMVTPFVHRHDWRRHSIALRLLYFPICLLLLLPLFSSASKHGLMSLAILASWLKPVFAIGGRWLATLLLAGVLIVAAVFEATVLYTTFPLQSRFPFINTQPGMYSVHQGTYTRMLKAHPRAFLFGLGITRAKEEYPIFADKALAKSVLERYNAMPSYENFITFIDAHNEYLNQLALFGAIPLILLLAFLLRQARNSDLSCVLLVTAMLCCCLWDDLLSKRPVWIALAIFSAPTGQYRQED